MEQCLACGGGPLKRSAKPVSFSYKGQVLTYQQPGEWCGVCGEGFLRKSDKEATDPVLADFQARLDNRLSPTEIRRIRKKLGLTQKQAGEMIGGGSLAFRRYETGKAVPPTGTENFLRVLDRHPDLRAELPKEVAA
ncbi:MAG: type II toxin-antitoxin system MqsA family antitoxin [Deltaproteobacteria bacterium]|nr:type II toxin-antitoxin system MqsA family antitoxin [Deltaproteobacteria bacterium]